MVSLVQGFKADFIVSVNNTQQPTKLSSTYDLSITPSASLDPRQEFEQCFELFSNRCVPAIVKSLALEQFSTKEESPVLKSKGPWEFIKRIFCPLDTQNRADFAKALLLPTFFNGALKINSLALRFFASFFAILLDVCTLPARLITSPYCIYLKYKKVDTEEPLSKENLAKSATSPIQSKLLEQVDLIQQTIDDLRQNNSCIVEIEFNCSHVSIQEDGQSAETGEAQYIISVGPSENRAFVRRTTFQRVSLGNNFWGSKSGRETYLEYREGGFMPMSQSLINQLRQQGYFSGSPAIL